MNHDLESHLDLSLLERVRHHANKVTARCPACAEQGQDRKAAHLVIFPSGKFACAAHPGDGEHQRRIFALVGVRQERDRDRASTFDRERRRREWARQRAREQEREQLRHTAQGSLRKLLERHRWDRAEVWEESPQRLDDPAMILDPRHFLATLYPPEEVLWTGAVHQSGPEHARRWRTCAEWQAAGANELGPMVTPALWLPGTVSRAAAQVRETPYVVVDFDGIGGVKPKTPEEREAHVADSLAQIRWLREVLDWRLAAIIATGGKGLHAWFEQPGPEELESLRGAAPVLGIDAGLIGRPEHPCRLPGQKHEGTGKLSELLWLMWRTPLACESPGESPGSQ